jgi:hypothetical protein
MSAEHLNLNFIFFRCVLPYVTKLAQVVRILNGVQEVPASKWARAQNIPAEVFNFCLSHCMQILGCLFFIAQGHCFLSSDDSSRPSFQNKIL